MESSFVVEMAQQIMLGNLFVKIRSLRVGSLIAAASIGQDSENGI